MAQAIDLTAKEWCDLVFANRNQVYGAYAIRQTSSRRHLMSLAIVTLLGVTFSALPTVMKKLFPAENNLKVENFEGKIVLMDELTEKDKEILATIKQAEVVDLKPTIKLTPPVIKPDPEVDEADEMLTQEALSNTNAAISIKTEVGIEGGTVDIADVKGHNAIAGKPTTEDKPFDIVEQMPQPPGGDKELLSYLSKNIKYPIPAIEMGIQGTVVLRFVVGKDGNIQDVTILRSLDSHCDKEAVRVVKSMPKWIPGRQNGIPVAVYYTLPVRFQLKG